MSKIGLISTLMMIVLTGAGLWGLHQWGKSVCEKEQQQERADVAEKQRDIANQPSLDADRLLDLMLDDKL